MATPATDPDLEGFLALLAATRAARTVDAYRRDLTDIASRLKRPLDAVTTEDLERYLAELRAEGRSSATLARRTAAARSFYRHLVLLGKRTENPAAAVALPRKARRLPRTLSDHPELEATSRLTLMESIRGVRLALWDEEQRRLISFREAAV